jgi:serine/threonine-protein phosphatase 2A regulatory subunit B''
MSRQYQGRRPPQMMANGGQNNNNNNNGDLYRQLIDSNDLVKELDDIEAISQQISQHAEVLYQSWKSNNQEQPQEQEQEQPTSHQRAAMASNPSSQNQKVASSSTTYGAGVGFPKRSMIQENGTDKSNGGSSSAAVSSSGTPIHKQNGGSLHHEPLAAFGASSTLPKATNKVSPLSSPTSTLTSPSFINKAATLPKSGPSDKPLELLASPEVNGSLKDLVNSFVSTDRAKQAARQTISSTITNQINRRNGSGPGFRSPSPTSSASSLSSRGVSPLRSPMLAAATAAGPQVHSPDGSNPTRRLMDAFPTNASIMNSQNVHTKMPPMFSPNPQSQSQSPAQAPQWPQPEQGVIRIPVQHITAQEHQHQQQHQSLRSPSILNILSTSSPTSPTSPLSPTSQSAAVPRLTMRTQPLQQPLNSGPIPITSATSLPTLHAAHVEHMKKRFEEAKERINAMHQRATTGPFPPASMASVFNDPFADPDFDLLRSQRRPVQRPLIAPPHPELTPQQKQHISERTVLTPNGGMLLASVGLNGGQLQPKRFGGSVAERVMIFERCPIFGSDLKDVRMPAVNLTDKRRHETPTPIAPWKNLQQEGMGQAQVQKHIL